MPEHSSKVKKRYASGQRYSEEATAKKRKTNCERWVSRCIKKYGSKFEYDEAIKKFETQKKPKVPVTCQVHGYRFPIIPDKHIQLLYGGCKYCEAEAISAASIKKQKKKFLKWFNLWE